MRTIIFTILLAHFSLSAVANDVVIPMTTVNGLYGGGTFSVPCSAPNMSAICQIDTGLNVSYFSSGAFQVQPNSIGKAKYVSVTGSVIECDYVSLPSIQIGDTLKSAPVEPVICPQETKNQTNLLGLDAFSDRSFVLSGKESRLVFLDQAPALPHRFETDDVGHIFMNIQSGFKKPKDVLAMFDTGAAISTVDIALVKAQPENFTIIETTPIGTDSFGNPINSYLVIGSVLVDQVKILAKYFIAMDLSAFQKTCGVPVQMILGYNAIADFDWTINMKDKTWAASEPKSK